MPEALAAEPAPALEPAALESSREAIAPEVTESAPAAPKLTWWKRLRQGLSRSSQAIGGGITDIFTKRKLDSETLQELEDVLIRADLGASASLRIAEAVGKGRYDKNVSPDEVKNILAAEVETVLAPLARPLEIDARKRPFVILVIGVNGSGKTTTIGKLAAKFPRDGHKVVLAAGDTFRAAAIEQLRIWGARLNARSSRASSGADAAGLGFRRAQGVRGNRMPIC